MTNPGSFNSKDPVHFIGAILAVVLLLGFIVYGIATCSALQS